MRKNEYELFGTTITITPWKYNVLKENLVSWVKLHEYLSSKFCTELDILRLIIIEKENDNRSHIVRRLHSRYISLRRQKQWGELGIEGK